MRINKFLFGSSFFLMLTLFIFLVKKYPFDIFFSVVIFTLVTLYIMLENYYLHTLISWRFGIPLFYFMYFFILPIIVSDIESEFADWGINFETISRSLLVATLGMISFQIGVKIFSRKKGTFLLLNRHNLDLLNNRFTFNLFINLGVLFSLLSVFLGFSTAGLSNDESGSSISSFILGFNILLQIGTLAAWSKYLIDNNHKDFISAVIGVFFLILVGLFSNSKAAMIYPIVMIGLLQFTVNTKAAYKYFVMVGIIYIFIAFPLITSFRFIMQQGFANVEKSVVISSFIDYLITGEWLYIDSNELYGMSAISSIDRAVLAYFSKIILETGSLTPFYYGDTYIYAIETFIPRILMPNKPNLSMGNILAQNYGMLQIDDTITGLSPSMMGEFYLNFSYFGVIFGMFSLAYLLMNMLSTIYKMGELSTIC